jgi:hypothetical protein
MSGRVTKKVGRKRKGPNGDSVLGKKKRNANWTNDEKTALVNSVAQNYDKLVGKFSTTVSVATKNSLWQKVADSVSFSELSKIIE